MRRLPRFGCTVDASIEREGPQMASSKRQTTFAKMAREQAVKERRARKQQKKDDKKQAAAAEIQAVADEVARG
jgi:hypothetical protein